MVFYDWLLSLNKDCGCWGQPNLGLNSSPATNLCVTLGESLSISEPLPVTWESDPSLIGCCDHVKVLVIPFASQMAAFAEPFSTPTGRSKIYPCQA